MNRRLLALTAALCGGLAIVQFATASKQNTTTSNVQPRLPAALVSSGRALFESSCASCHGMNAQGIPGRAPSLHGVGALAADFYLQTGRMPLPSPRAQPLRSSPAFPQSQIKALVAYVASF